MKSIFLSIGATNFKFVGNFEGSTHKGVIPSMKLQTWFSNQNIKPKDNIFIYLNKSCFGSDSFHKHIQGVFTKNDLASNITLLPDQSFYGAIKEVITHFPLNDHIFIKFGGSGVTIFNDGQVSGFLPFNLLQYELDYSKKFPGRYLFKDFLLFNKWVNQEQQKRQDQLNFIRTFMKDCKNSVMRDEIKPKLLQLFHTTIKQAMNSRLSPSTNDTSDVALNRQVVTLHGGGAQYFYLLMREFFPSPVIVIDYIPYCAELQLKVLSKFSAGEKLPTLSTVRIRYYIREDNLFGVRIETFKELEFYLKNLYANFKIEVFTIAPYLLAVMSGKKAISTRRLPLSRLEPYQVYNIAAKFSETYSRAYIDSLSKKINLINESPPHPRVVVRPIMLPDGKLGFEPVENCLSTGVISGHPFTFRLV